MCKIIPELKMPTSTSKPRHNYYPFGSSLNTRGFSAGNGFRFGFNGKEKQIEFIGDDYDFGARIYDGRLGRWMSVDPFIQEYLFNSPYSFTANCVLAIKEIQGKNYIVYFDPSTKTISIKAQFKIEKSGNLTKDANTKTTLEDAIEMFNNTKGFQVILNENGKEVAYDVVFKITLIEENKSGDGPTNTIKIDKINLPSSMVNNEDAIGICKDDYITVDNEYNDKIWNVMKHEIGHALGMDHESGEDYLMSEFATTEHVNVDIENVKSTLGRIGIGQKSKPRDLGGIGEGQLVRPPNLIFTERDKMDEFYKNLEDGKIQQKED